MSKTFVRTLSIILALLFLAPAGFARGEEVSVTASAAIVLDYETGEVLFAKDIDTLRVPASMTKIMTAYIIFEEMERGNFTKDTMITVSPTAAAMSKNTAYPMTVPLASGEAYSVDQLLKLIMVPSASASCYVMAEHISGTEAAFTERMNKTAADMGIQAKFENCHGAMPHYITARGVATLIRNFIQKYPDILTYSSLTETEFNGITYFNTNRLLSSDYYYEGADGFKTGTITAAGYCLSATAVQGGRRIISVVMNSTNTNTRHTDSRTILDYGFAELERRDASRAATELEGRANREKIRLGADLEVTFSVNGADTAYEAAGVFTIDGETVKTFDTAMVSNGTKFSLTHCFDKAGAEDTVIGFTLIFPDGTAREVSVSIPFSGESPAPYRDVDRHWAEAAISELSEIGVFQGNGSSYFNPGGELSRGMFVTLLGRMAENLGLDTIEPGATGPFDDVEQGAWYSDYVAWAFEHDIVNGYGASFGPEDAISREQAAAILFRFFEVFEIDVERRDETAFSDFETISDWAREHVAAAAEAGLIRGYEDGSFRPMNNVTRAEAALILYRFMTQ